MKWRDITDRATRSTRILGDDPGLPEPGRSSYGPRSADGGTASAGATLNGAPTGRSFLDGHWRALAKSTLGSSGFWGLVLAIATWAGNGADLRPQPGLDPSWLASLYMQAHLGMAAGPHGVFAYGPLGFLTIVRLYYPGLALLALIYNGVMSVAVYGLLVFGIRRFASLPVSVLAALLAGGPVVINYRQVEAWIPVGCFCAVYIIRQPAGRSASVWWWAALGVMAGVNLLTKTTVAVYLVLACLVVVACAPRGNGYRQVCALAGSGVASFVVGWVGTGNGVSNFISFAKGAGSVALGYSSAMSCSCYSHPLYKWLLMGLTAVVLAVTAIGTQRVPGLAQASRLGSGLVSGFAWPEPASGHLQPSYAGSGHHQSAGAASPPPTATHVSRYRQVRSVRESASAAVAGRRRRIQVAVGMALVLGLSVLVLYKEAVVRQGPRAYFASLPILLVAALIGRPIRVRAFGRAGLVALALAAALLGYLANNPGTNDIPSAAGFGRLVDQVTTVLARSGPKISKYRAALQADYALPPEVLDRIGGRTVAIDPWENTISWAYPQLHWDPLPVIQDYSAYTTYLDKLDASFLASSRAPTYILRQSITIDGRSPMLDPPLTQLEIACRYYDIKQFNGWQLLESAADRCGTPTPIGTVSVGYGQIITVPSAPPGDMITATLALQRNLSWDLRGTLYRPLPFLLRINDSSQVFRFISGTAEDMHMIRAPASLGWGRGFAPTPIRAMTITEAKHAATSSGVVVHFYAIPMSPGKRTDMAD